MDGGDVLRRARSTPQRPRIGVEEGCSGCDVLLQGREQQQRGERGPTVGERELGCALANGGGGDGGRRRCRTGEGAGEEWAGRIRPRERERFPFLMGSNQTRLGADPSVAQGHRMSKTKFSLLNRLKPGRGVLWPNFNEPECLLADCSKLGVRQQTTITLNVCQTISPFLNRITSYFETGRAVTS